MGTSLPPPPPRFIPPSTSLPLPKLIALTDFHHRFPAAMSTARKLLQLSSN